MKITLLSILLGSCFFGPLALGQTLSSYDYCGDKRAALGKLRGNPSPDCLDAVTKAAKCCNGTLQGCTIAPGTGVTGGGAKASGGETAAANLALSDVLKKNINYCDNSQMTTLKPCMNTPDDKKFRQEYQTKENDLTECLQLANTQALARVPASNLVQGRASSGSGTAATPECSGEMSAEQQVKCLGGK